tara:strand:+ start:166 stop:627 length:462 start_codon:yes stop_codon:yes gene_type:complete
MLDKSKSRKSLNLTSFLSVLSITCLSAMVSEAFGQDVLSEIKTFNEVIGGDYVVSNKKKILIVKGFREGKQVKVDKVNVFDLDMKSLKFSEVDNAVSIKCYSDLEGCVEKTLTRERNKKSYRNRVVIGLGDNVVGSEVKGKLKLVLEEMFEKY